MKLFTKVLLVLSAFLLFYGCGTKNVADMFPAFEPANFEKSNYNAKADNFIILFDASSSMHEKFDQVQKFDIAKEIATRMNANIPELSQTAGLRSFGHSPKVAAMDTKLFFGMANYKTGKLQAGLDKVTEPGGFSPLYKAIDAAGQDLKGLSGKRHAVVIISDGKDLPGDVLKSAKNLKAMYGDKICFYTILVGDAPEGEKLLQKIADIGSCGFFSYTDEVMTNAGMANFVEEVFLEKRKEVAMEKRKDTRFDSDKDGVYDEDDKCPGTPAGAKVNAQGCWVLGNALFDYNKDEIKPEAAALLKDVAAVLKKNYNMNVELHGHCDSRGGDAYNMDLSLRRANAVKTYLNSKGVVLSRMTVKGYGESKPVASNATDAGRAQNRRVEIHPIK